MFASWIRLFASLALFSTLSMGCSGSGGDSPDAGPVPILDFVEMEIGSAGGTVELPNKALVEIPPGALDAPVRVRIEELDRTRVAAGPGSTRDLSAAYAFKPHGTTFNIPVRMRIAAEEVPGRVRVYRLEDEYANRWRLVPDESKDASRVVVNVDKFSVYSVVTSDTGMNCGAVDDDDDGVLDFCDTCDNGIDSQDGDGDGIPDACDFCPLINHQEGAFFGECIYGEYASLDTAVISSTPDTNFGFDSFLSVGGMTDTRYGHVRFDLGGIPAGAAVSNAQLYLFQSGGVANGNDLELYTQASGWGEFTATYNTGPTTGLAFLDSIVSDTFVAQGFWVTQIDPVRAWVETNAGNNVNFTLAYTGAVLEVASRQAGISTNRPWLAATHEPYTEVIRPAIEDAMVDPQQPDANFGDAASMTVGANGAIETNIRYVFLKFDVSGLSSMGGLAEVALEMNSIGGEAYGGSGQVVIAPVMDDTWSEATLTYTNMPTADTPSEFTAWNISEPELGAHSRSFWNSFLYGVVLNEYSGDGTLSIRLAIDEAAHEYHSSESLVQALAPRLRIWRDNSPP